MADANVVDRGCDLGNVVGVGRHTDVKEIESRSEGIVGEGHPVEQDHGAVLLEVDVHSFLVHAEGIALAESRPGGEQCGCDEQDHREEGKSQQRIQSA